MLVILAVRDAGRTQTVPAMFAVTGWSVSADILKTQANPSSQSSSHVALKGKKEQLSKKRKRGTKQPSDTEISGDNLAELWVKHIEGGGRKAIGAGDNNGVEQQHKKKRRKGKDRNTESVAKQAQGLQVVECQDKNEKQFREKEPYKLTSDPENEGDHIAEDVDKAATTQESKETGKVKYEARMKKKLEKELLRASGRLPPSRPAQSPNSMQTPQISKHTSAVREAEDAIKEDESSLAIDPSERSKSKANLKAKSTNEASKESRLPSPPTTAASPIEKKPKAKKPNSHNMPLPPPYKATSAPPSTTTLPPLASPAPPTTSKLTPLQAKMQSKLLSARFRHLNQTLYTSPSAQASALFTSTPSAYTSYHAGFRAQVAVWPQNPVETFIADVKTRGAVRREGLGAQKKAWRVEKRGKGMGRKGSSETTAAPGVEGNKDIDPLPRTSKTCTIADLGCGDATLAASLLPNADPKNKSLKLKLHSFDLAKGDGPNVHLVTVADITSVPLKDGEVDVAVLCLSLMGTNWVSCVDEVARVVRWGGEAWVAEIKSRFARAGKRREGGIGKMKETAKSGKKRKGGAGGEDDDGDEEGGIGDVVEVDSDPDILAPGKTGKEKKKPEEDTDVTAFVEVWRQRGFELKGEVDLGNKMFVRMRFVKRGKPKEDGVVIGSDRSRGKSGAKTKFIDEEKDEHGGLDEATVLKPCVYKLR